ncbi:YdeI/OmpD-associated family protein [Halomonas kalidii]|uniref:YdeI/OmpD-associated family protein n=1 Tax=Halomonas kalidii TaxID=3043293 RepID=A0ABT6VI73_9GAMM|nr:YdeI/OmpD-associated family protein [Halomonas kalidii]MDI5933671.1 YdeI/OmpD-associated family protein [Halomonas kalidii]
MRQIRFAQTQEIDALEPVLRAYLHEAIDVEKAGLSVDFKEKHELEYPEEFRLVLVGNAVLKAAFEALTPGRQRGYILHVSGAKQSSTRTSRIEKCIPSILEGKGLNDR